MKDSINIGLIGFGNIGTGVVNTLNKNGSKINADLKKPLKLTKIADIDTTTKRNADYDPSILTNDAFEIINDPDIDIVIELIGGVGVAKTFVEAALKKGKHVVTANKSLLAQHGVPLYKLACENNVGLFFEASVGGGIPVIQTLREGLPANNIIGLYGIVNGTANYILTRMTLEGIDFETVLKDAQAKGLAEPDPTFDIEGFDSAHKTAVIATIAFGQDIRFEDVYVEGISRVTAMDIGFAKEFGYTIKLLASAKKDLESGSIEVSVAPTLVPKKSMLSSVSYENNAFLIQGDIVGELMFYGKGAGPAPTSSAVISDLVYLAKQIEAGNPCGSNNICRIPIGEKKIKPLSEMEALYYVRMRALDKPGTMSKISEVLAQNNISINSLMQKGEHAPHEYVPLIIITHKAKESDIQQAIKNFKELDVVYDDPFVLRLSE